MVLTPMILSVYPVVLEHKWIDSLHFKSPCLIVSDPKQESLMMLMFVHMLFDSY